VSVAVSAIVLVISAGARAQDIGDTGVPMRAVEDEPMRLSFDRFDTGLNAGPLWPRLPDVPFLNPRRETESPISFAFDPDPLGPPQPLRPLQQARSLLDPAPMGPLADLQERTPAVAMGSPQVPESPVEGAPQPEETGSVVILRRRY
jgi:hypothetical protein